MPKKNREYWQERYEQLEKSAHSYSLSTYAQIEPAFTQAQMEIQKDIDAWYGRIAVNNNVTLQEAKKLLTADELAEFKWDVNEYIKYGKENAINHQWVKQLENASAKYHINKLEALKIRTQQAVEKAFGNELDAVDSMARKVYSNSYYHSIFEMQKGFNMGREIATIDEKALEKIITKPWAADGKNFSDRIWQSKAQLVNELHNQLTRTVLLGNKPDSAIKAISDKFNVSKSQAANLVMTEQSYFHSLATYDSFKSMGIKEYEFLATLDKKTTQMCRSMDGEHFPMSEYMPGATAPPLHPRCRSITVPYFDDEYSDLFNNGSMRTARNEDGKTYYVPADMTYRDWEKKFVVQNPKTRKNNKITLNKIVNTANQIVNSSVQQKEHKESKLTYDEEYAINQYVSSTAYNLNEKLRNNLPLTADEKKIKINLNNALNKLPKYQGTVVRDLYFDDEAELEKFINGFSIGNVKEFKEFISTTKAASYNDESQVKLLIDCKTGADLKGYNDYELEVLYPLKKSFDVLNVKNKNGITYIMLKEAIDKNG